MSIKKIKLDFEIDELTNCIVNTKTKERFQTIIEPLDLFDLKKIKYQEWSFNWILENSKNDRKVYKLFIGGNSKIIHGLVSLSDKSDHVQMNLIENAKRNIGKNKTYDGVAGNLVAFSCKTSHELGYEGYLLFTAKTKLIPHYKKS